jgi:putative transferase (TIGR04331 family)
MFWNPGHWEVRSDAQGPFDLLRKAGILHDTPQAAATKLNEIYPDTMNWWKSAEVQQARRLFSGTFVYTGQNWKDEWKRELLSLGSAPQGMPR